MKNFLLLFILLFSITAHAKTPSAHNVVIFVADGLRGAMVDAETTPALDALRREGVAFPNSHALYPSVTTANASVIATGHYLGDTGNFANTLFMDFDVTYANGEQTITPFLENNEVLGTLDEHFNGNYLNETTLLAAARTQGFSTAAIGKVGPTLIMDHTERSGEQTIIVDDKTGIVNAISGKPDGIPLTIELNVALQAAGLPPAPPAASKPNSAQQDYLLDVTSKVILPLLIQRKKPFVLVFWSRDPDYTQHYQLDSRYGMVPGINGSSSLAAMRNADDSLRRIRLALKQLGLAQTTNIFVTSDHGFSTISKQSDSSPAVKRHYENLPVGFLPPGFLALDLAEILDLPLWDPDNHNQRVDLTQNQRPKIGSGLIGRDPEHPDLVVAANGGSDLIYLRSDAGKSYAAILINALLAQDYTGGIFVNDALGTFAGTIPLSAIGLTGTARTPHPDIIISFRSFSTGCTQPLRCGAELADTTLQQGQGMHGSFSRADTFNFMAAVGPDFKRGFSDPAPVSNADIAPTLARILGVDMPPQGKLNGRVLKEAQPGGKIPKYIKEFCSYATAELGAGPNRDLPPLTRLTPVLQYQAVENVRYFDAAGLQGRVLGLENGQFKSCSF